jgi:amino acid transporter
VAEGKLKLFDAVGMAIGGMVGGGIFAVLGQAVGLSGNAAFLGFAFAGLLALITGISYSRLTVAFDHSGCCFTFVEEVAGAGASGTLSWFLMLGYVFAIGLYAYTFGAYASSLFGLGRAAQPYVGGLIVVLLSGLNLVGVRESGIAEDLFVYAKVAIILLTAGAGFFAIERQQALPVFEHGLPTVLGTAALIFVAYEGFELLTYDYSAIEDHHRNLLRATVISVLSVIFLYVLVAFVTTAALPDKVIMAHKETVLAYVAQPVLGQAGVTAVMIAAVLSTASAINATVFATARLANRFVEHGQLPSVLTRYERGGVPVLFVVLSALGAMALQLLGSLERIVSFASLVFLAVFAIVNLAAFVHKSYGGWWRPLPLLGALGCAGAAVALLVSTYEQNHADLWVIVGIAVGLLALRGLYMLTEEFEHHRAVRHSR